MSDILASIDIADVRLDTLKEDAHHRFLASYVDFKGTPRHFLLLGIIVKITELHEDLRLLILGSPPETAPTIREMFRDQHKKLDLLMARDSNNISLHLANRQAWCQGDSTSSTGFIYVRMSQFTTTDLSDLSSDVEVRPFASFAPEVPLSPDNVPVLDIGALVICVVDMFRADLPLQSMDGSFQGLHERVRAVISVHRTLGLGSRSSPDLRRRSADGVPPPTQLHFKLLRTSCSNRVFTQ
ncbi:hypothetical protein C8R47DRAFT_1211098 [Mycena vitilis]|nr:hypothetical protein C8R47DRAFT_1211098 [Mycena vitilis]